MKKKKYAWNIFFKKNDILLIYTFIYVIAAFLSFNIFFEIWYVSVIFTFCGLPFFMKKMKKSIRKKRQTQIENDFYKLLGQISMSLSSGMSIGNAFKEAVEVGKKEYKYLYKNLEGAYRLIQNNYSIEYAFKIIAMKTENNEIKTFSEIISIGIPAGIDMAGLMRWLSATYRMRFDTESEIVRILNAPKYNHQIVLIMPIVCIFLFKQIAPSYMETLYSGSGKVIMICVVVAIAFAWWIGEKISNIDY